MLQYPKKSTFTFLVLIGLIVPLFGQKVHLRNPDFQDYRIPFIENKGQWDDRIEFRVPIQDGSLFLLNNKLLFNYVDSKKLASIRNHKHSSIKTFGARKLKDNHIVNYHAYEMSFPGANESPKITTTTLIPGHFNYYIGKDRSKWQSHVRQFAVVNYENLFDGIDLKVYSNQKKLKYDFIVQPGVNPDQIKINYTGVDELFLKDGRLHVYTSVKKLIENAPIAYQVVDGARQEVKCSFELNGDQLSFKLGRYNKKLPLVIDPEVIGCTYTGSTRQIDGHSATYDSEGNIYASGAAYDQAAGEIPVTPGAYQQDFVDGVDTKDMAVVKYTPDATTLIYATYLGGNGDDYPHSMMADSKDDLLILGSSSSTDYPTTAGAFDENSTKTVYHSLVVSKLSPDGTALLNSTYVQGNAEDGYNALSYIVDFLNYNYGDAHRGEIYVDANDDVYVAAMSNSTDFPTTPGALNATNQGQQDAVAFRMSNDLSTMIWSTYIGSSGQDVGYGIRGDGSGGAYVTGTVSANELDGAGGGAFPAYQGGKHDGFVMHINNTGTAALGATYFGSNDEDQSFLMDLDPDGNVYIFGHTKGTINSTAGTYAGNETGAFIAKFSPDLTTHEWTSATNYMSPNAFAVDICYRIYVCGNGAFNTILDNFEVSDDAFDPDGEKGMYIMVLAPEASSMIFGSYYGNRQAHVDGGTSRFDPNGMMYLGVCTDGGHETTPGAHADDLDLDASATEQWELLAAKIEVAVEQLDVGADVSPEVSGCAPFTVNFENNTVGAISYEWDFKDGSATSTDEEPTHTFTSGGIYQVELTANGGICVDPQTVTLEIEVFDPAPPVADFETVVDCEARTVTITNNSTDVEVYAWDLGDGTNLSVADPGTHTYASEGSYNIVLDVSENTCNQTDQIAIPIVIGPMIAADISADNTSANCPPLTVNFSNLSDGITHEWDFGDGNSDTQVTPSHTFTDAGTYIVNFVTRDPNSCNLEDDASITIVVDDSPEVTADFAPTTTFDCLTGEVSLVNNTTGGNMAYEWDMGDGTTYTSTDVPNHTYANPGEYTISLEATDLVCNKSGTRSAIVDWDPSHSITLPPAPVICPEGTVTIGEDFGPDYTYSWSNGATTATIDVSDSDINLNETFTLDVMYGVCPASDQITVREVEPILYTNQRTICTGEETTLSTGMSFAQYDWDNGDEAAERTVKTAGEYSLRMQDSDGCWHDGEFVVYEVAPPYFYVPNSFSPNGDGENDEFSPLGLDNGVMDYQFWIFNRWGELMFYTEDINATWKGDYLQNANEIETYVYKIKYKTECTGDQTLKTSGHVNLLK